MVNQPDSNSHCYIALVLELGDNLIARIRQAYPELVQDLDFGHSSQIELDIPLTSQLAQSFVYLVRTVVNNTTENSSYLHEHRLMEVILLLLQSNRRSQFLKIIYPDFLTVYALDVENLPADKTTTGAKLAFLIKDHILAKATITAKFGR
ncbi:MAG: hypothetical protein ACRC2S_07525 [Waterburya sp.]